MRTHFLAALLFILTQFLPESLYGQSETWPVRAVLPDGQLIDVRGILENGDQLEVYTSSEGQSSHFMDVMARYQDRPIPVKMLVSSDFYVPVKAIGPGGKIIDVKAVDQNGNILDVKGVGRKGSRIVMAAITPEGEFLRVVAIMDDGTKRELSGLKFVDENIEMEIDQVQILAHVRALPEVSVESDLPEWEITASLTDGEGMNLVAIDKDGNEYVVKGLAAGGNYHVLDVKAMIRNEPVPVKLVKHRGVVSMAAIDEFGREIPVKIKMSDGKYGDLRPGKRSGNTIEIRGGLSGDMIIRAVSPLGHKYEVKGIKLKSEDKEGSFMGYSGDVYFYAHVKALPPVR